MYRAHLHGKAFEVDSDADQWLVNGDPFTWDITSLGNGHYHIIYRDKGYRAEVVSVDNTSKTVSLKINNTTYTIQLKNKFDLLLDKMGMSAGASHKINIVKAPMPGLIIDLRVKVGETVKAGDPLLVLEAMKMENIIKSPGAGTVKLLKVKKGDAVEKGQVMIEF